MRAVFLGTCLILAAAAASAQFPLGQATPVNGFGAALFGEPLWIGNPGYGYRIAGAPPGGSAIVAISLARQDQTIGGLGVYLDLGSVLVTHSGPVDATGRAAFQFPLNSPDDPALTGLQFYAQGAVVDPADDSVGTTEALLLEIAAHPMVAWTTWTGTLYLLDPVEGTIQHVPGLPPTATVLDLTFANAGRDVFVASSEGIFVVDTFAAAPQAVSLLAGSWSSIAWDRVHRRAYAVGPQGLVGLDGDRASPAFGTNVAQVSDATNLASLAVSTAGNLFALATVDGIVTRRDADPASPTYLQLIPMPGDFSSWIPTVFGRVQISPDGRVITMPVHVSFGPWGPAVHRFDGNAGVWVDFDPATPGYQPLSPVTHSGLAGLTTTLPDTRRQRSRVYRCRCGRAGGPRSRLSRERDGHDDAGPDARRRHQVRRSDSFGHLPAPAAGSVPQPRTGRVGAATRVDRIGDAVLRGPRTGDDAPDHAGRRLEVADLSARAGAQVIRGAQGFALL